MRELGYVEGRNIRYKWRHAEMDRLDRLASELVQAKVDVIVVGATTPSRAAQKATRTIPIVFFGVADPVASA